ncbi:MAG: hypothetical protein K2M80_06795, partial [Muribaculaceae bacterium]|nr:hypothetical protein [Muribaculaceae bacterium]
APSGHRDPPASAEAADVRSTPTREPAPRRPSGRRQRGVDRAEARAEAYKRRGQFRDDAMEEYMSDLGGRIGDRGFEKMSRQELTLWGTIKVKVQQFLDAFLKKMNLSARIRLSDKDLAYILFKSWKHAKEQAGTADPNLKMIDRAEDIAMRHRTGYGQDPLKEMSKREQAEARRQRRKAVIERIAAEEDEYINDPAEKVVISGRDDMKSLMRRLGYTEAEAEEDAHEYEKMLASDRVRCGSYDPVTKKIIIFAETLSGPTATRLTMQHEELHHQIDVNEQLSHAAKVLVPALKELRNDIWQEVDKAYSHKGLAEREEELVVFTIEKSIRENKLKELYDDLRPDAQEQLTHLLNSIGYEKEEPVRQNDG